jgi:hypothetical protein
MTGGTQGKKSRARRPETKLVPGVLAFTSLAGNRAEAD